MATKEGNKKKPTVKRGTGLKVSKRWLVKDAPSVPQVTNTERMVEEIKRLHRTMPDNADFLDEVFAYSKVALGVRFATSTYERLIRKAIGLEARKRWPMKDAFLLDLTRATERASLKTDQKALDKKPANKHIGSNFDDYLKEEGTFEEVDAAARANAAQLRTQEGGNREALRGACQKAADALEQAPSSNGSESMSRKEIVRETDRYSNGMNLQVRCDALVGLIADAGNRAIRNLERVNTHDAASLFPMLLLFERFWGFIENRIDCPESYDKHTFDGKICELLASVKTGEYARVEFKDGSRVIALRSLVGIAALGFFRNQFIIDLSNSQAVSPEEVAEQEKKLPPGLTFMFNGPMYLNQLIHDRPPVKELSITTLYRVFGDPISYLLGASSPNLINVTEDLLKHMTANQAH